MTVIQLHPPIPQRDEPKPFRLGVNYWPAAKGPGFFKEFDIDEVHCDMNTVAELGLDFVRVFLNWEDFQPDPESVNCRTLAHLASLCDAAAAEGLKVIVTLFSGHLMGHNWVPHWLLAPEAQAFAGIPVISRGKRITGGYREPLEDPQARKAALRLVRAVARTLSDHQALWAFDMGNVPNLFSQPTSAHVAADWYVELAGALRNLDEQHEITCAVGAHTLCSRDGVRLDITCACLNFGCIGEQTAEFAKVIDRLDPKLLAFSCALASELTGKPCLSGSWNLSTLPPSPEPIHSTLSSSNENLVSERTAVEYAEEALPALVASGAIGTLVGNYTDFDATLFGTPPFDICVSERYRGLWRSDGTLKPHGRVIREFAETNPSIQVPPLRRARVDVSVDTYYNDPLSHCRRIFQDFSANAPVCRSLQRIIKPTV